MINKRLTPTKKTRDSSVKMNLLGPDARSKRGIFSRGKANYGGLMNAPNPPSFQTLAKRKLQKKNG